MKIPYLLFCISMLLCDVHSKKHKANACAHVCRKKAVAEYFNKYRQPFQDFCIDVKQGGTIKTFRGIEFTFDPNSFVNENGEAVTGEIDIKLKEFLKKNDLIFNQTFIVSDQVPLLIDGKYEMQIMQNTEKIKLAHHNTYSVKMPSASVMR